MKTLVKLVAIIALATCHGQQLTGRRPQDPVKPYPYREEEVVYENPVAAVNLPLLSQFLPGKDRFRPFS